MSMTNHWKSLALILTGILVGCAGNAAQTALADGSSKGSASFKCLGPSGTTRGIENDLNALAAEGYEPFLSTNTVVCGKR